MLPKRRFWKAGRTFCRPFRMRFRSTFQRFLSQIRYSHPWKVLRKRILKGLQKARPAFQNLRLGGVNFRVKRWSNIRISSVVPPSHPKRRFWKVWQKMKCIFSKHFQWLVAKIEYSRPWKCFLRNPHFIFCQTFQNLRLRDKVEFDTERAIAHYVLVGSSHRQVIDMHCDPHISRVGSGTRELWTPNPERSRRTESRNRHPTLHRNGFDHRNSRQVRALSSRYDFPVSMVPSGAAVPSMQGGIWGVKSLQKMPSTHPTKSACHCVRLRLTSHPHTSCHHSCQSARTCVKWVYTTFREHDLGHNLPCSEQKIAQFRTHYLTKELAYVSTQQSGQFDTFLLNHFSVHCILAWLLSTNVWTFLR